MTRGAGCGIMVPRPLGKGRMAARSVFVPVAQPTILAPEAPVSASLPPAQGTA